MSNGKKLAAGSIVGVAAVILFAAGARGQGPAAKGGVAAADEAGAPSRAEFNKLQAEVREQKQLILDMLQAEQQRYEMLLKIIRAGGGASAEDLPAFAMPGAAANPTAAPAEKSAQKGRGPVEAPRRTGTLEGRIQLPPGSRSADVYVYVENVRAPHVRGKSIEIKQENKQFSPRLAVVQAGTNVVFPNFDAVYHNVFSVSPHNTFDLGTYRAGDKPRSVTLTSPGVVEIFCNMHQRMSADVLVVPSPLYARARADGTFHIDNVPVGMRKVVAWSPGLKASQQRVDVTPAGAEVTFALEREEARAHANKFGQAYGSYRE